MNITSSELPDDGSQPRKLPETLEPLTGILTLRHRKVDSGRWTCLLCKTRNTTMWEYCKACHRDKYPQWMRDVEGKLVHPGVAITGDGIELGMVTKITRLPDQIVAFFPKEDPERPFSDWVLEERVIPAEKVRSFQVVEDKRVDLFLRFGLCGDCGRVYSIKMGHTHLHTENDTTLLRIKLSRKKADLAKLVEEKKRLVRMQKKAEVFDYTRRIKAGKREIEGIHAELGGAPLWCPHCFWRPTY